MLGGRIANYTIEELPKTNNLYHFYAVHKDGTNEKLALHLLKMPLHRIEKFQVSKSLLQKQTDPAFILQIRDSFETLIDGTNYFAIVTEFGVFGNLKEMLQNPEFQAYFNKPSNQIKAMLDIVRGVSSISEELSIVCKYLNPSAIYYHEGTFKISPIVKSYTVNTVVTTTNSTSKTMNKKFYQAPQIASSEMEKAKPTASANVWSLGLIFLQIMGVRLGDTPPCSRENLEQIFSSFPSAKLEDAFYFIKRMLAKDPFDRPYVEDVVQCITGIYERLVNNDDKPDDLSKTQAQKKEQISSSTLKTNKRNQTGFRKIQFKQEWFDQFKLTIDFSDFLNVMTKQCKKFEIEGLKEQFQSLDFQFLLYQIKEISNLENDFNRKYFLLLLSKLWQRKNRSLLHDKDKNKELKLIFEKAWNTQSEALHSPNSKSLHNYQSHKQFIQNIFEKEDFFLEKNQVEMLQAYKTIVKQDNVYEVLTKIYIQTSEYELEFCEIDLSFTYLCKGIDFLAKTAVSIDSIDWVKRCQTIIEKLKESFSDIEKEQDQKICYDALKIQEQRIKSISFEQQKSVPQLSKAKYQDIMSQFYRKGEVFIRKQKKSFDYLEAQELCQRAESFKNNPFRSLKLLDKGMSYLRKIKSKLQRDECKQSYLVLVDQLKDIIKQRSPNPDSRVMRIVLEISQKELRNLP